MTTTDLERLELAGRNLTKREMEILELAANGLTNVEIGAKLYLSAETIKSHMRHVLAKLNARNRTHAVALGFKLRYLSTD